MAIYHARVKTFSRAKGHSSLAAAAYRAGLLLLDEITGTRHDYRRRGGVVETRCVVPDDAPDWALTPAELWPAAERAERRKDATVAREFEVALPHELTDEQRSALAGEITRALVERYRFAAQVSIHSRDAKDGLNWHAHILATTRRVATDGFADKTRELDGGPAGRAEIEWVREMVARVTNAHLAAAEVDAVRLKEKRKDSQEAREFEIALPCELTDDQRSDLAWDICRDLVGRYGFAIQASIHEPPTRGGQNWHLHALATTRRIRDDGLHDKTRELDGGASGKAEVEWVREMVASRTNDHLAAAGHTARVDHRNFSDQLTAAIEKGDLERAAELAGREATLPMGKSAIALQRLGADCAIADANRSIRQRNAQHRSDLRHRMAENGYLPAPSEGHGHEQALRDRQRELGQPIALGGSGSVGSIQGLGPLTDLRTPAERQDAKRAEARTAFSEAAKLWAEDFIATIDLAFVATRKLLAHHAERAASFAHLPSFRADVRAFVKCLKRIKEDALRFRRRLETEDRLSHLVSQAQTELTRFDGEHPHPGLWTKRQWQMRRARRLQAVGQRQEAHRKAVEATQPEAQADYTRRAVQTGVELERLSASMLARYPLQSDLAFNQRAATEDSQFDMPATRGPRLQ